MSDTPRTDIMVADLEVHPNRSLATSENSFAHFARRIERELATMKEENERLKAALEEAIKCAGLKLPSDPLGSIRVRWHCLNEGDCPNLGAYLRAKEAPRG